MDDFLIFCKFLIKDIRFVILSSSKEFKKKKLHLIKTKKAYFRKYFFFFINFRKKYKKNIFFPKKTGKNREILINFNNYLKQLDTEIQKKNFKQFLFYKIFLLSEIFFFSKITEKFPPFFVFRLSFFQKIDHLINNSNYYFLNKKYKMQKSTNNFEYHFLLLLEKKISTQKSTDRLDILKNLFFKIIRREIKKKNARSEKFLSFFKKKILTFDGDFFLICFIKKFLETYKIEKNKYIFFERWNFFLKNFSLLQIKFPKILERYIFSAFLVESDDHKKKYLERNRNWKNFFPGKISEEFSTRTYLRKNKNSLKFFDQLVSTNKLKKKSHFKKVLKLNFIEKNILYTKNVEIFFSSPQYKQKFFLLFWKPFLTGERKNTKDFRKIFCIFKNTKNLGKQIELLEKSSFIRNILPGYKQKENKLCNFFSNVLINNIKNRNKILKHFVRKIYKSKKNQISEIITPIFHNVMTDLNWLNLIQINKKKFMLKKQLPSPNIGNFESFSDKNGCFYIKTLKIFLKNNHILSVEKKNPKIFLRKEKEKNIYWISDNMTIPKNIKNFSRFFYLKKKNEQVQDFFFFFHSKNFFLAEKIGFKTFGFYLQLIFDFRFNKLLEISNIFFKKKKNFEKIFSSCLKCFWKNFMDNLKKLPTTKIEKTQKKYSRFKNNIITKTLKKQIQKKVFFFFFFRKNNLFYDLKMKKNQISSFKIMRNLRRKKKISPKNTYETKNFTKNENCLKFIKILRYRNFFDKRKRLDLISHNFEITRLILFASIFDRDPFLEIISTMIKKNKEIMEKIPHKTKKLQIYLKQSMFVNLFEKRTKFINNFFERIFFFCEISFDKFSSKNYKKKSEIFFTYFIPRINYFILFTWKNNFFFFWIKTFLKLGEIFGKNRIEKSRFVLKPCNKKIFDFSDQFMLFFVVSKNSFSLKEFFIFLSNFYRILPDKSSSFRKFLFFFFKNSKDIYIKTRKIKKILFFFFSFSWFNCKIARKKNSKYFRSIILFLLKKNLFGDLFFLIFSNLETLIIEKKKLYFGKCNLNLKKYIFENSSVLDRLKRVKNFKKEIKFVLNFLLERSLLFKSPLNFSSLSKIFFLFEKKKKKNESLIYFSKKTDYHRKSVFLSISGKLCNSGFISKKKLIMIFRRSFQQLLKMENRSDFSKKTRGKFFLFFNFFCFCKFDLSFNFLSFFKKNFKFCAKSFEKLLYINTFFLKKFLNCLRRKIKKKTFQINSNCFTKKNCIEKISSLVFHLNNTKNCNESSDKKLLFFQNFILNFSGVILRTSNFRKFRRITQFFFFYFKFKKKEKDFIFSFNFFFKLKCIHIDFLLRKKKITQCITLELQFFQKIFLKSLLSNISIKNFFREKSLFFFFVNDFLYWKTCPMIKIKKIGNFRKKFLYQHLTLNLRFFLNFCFKFLKLRSFFNILFFLFQLKIDSSEVSKAVFLIIERNKNIFSNIFLDLLQKNSFELKSLLQFIYAKKSINSNFMLLKINFIIMIQSFYSQKILSNISGFFHLKQVFFLGDYFFFLEETFYQKQFFDRSNKNYYQNMYLRFSCLASNFCLLIHRFKNSKYRQIEILYKIFKMKKFLSKKHFFVFDYKSKIKIIFKKCIFYFLKKNNHAYFKNCFENDIKSYHEKGLLSEFIFFSIFAIFKQKNRKIVFELDTFILRFYKNIRSTKTRSKILFILIALFKIYNSNRSKNKFFCVFHRILSISSNYMISFFSKNIFDGLFTRLANNCDNQFFDYNESLIKLLTFGLNLSSFLSKQKNYAKNNLKNKIFRINHRDFYVYQFFLPPLVKNEYVLIEILLVLLKNIQKENLLVEKKGYSYIFSQISLQNFFKKNLFWLPYFDLILYDFQFIEKTFFDFLPFYSLIFFYNFFSFVFSLLLNGNLFFYKEKPLQLFCYFYLDTILYKKKFLDFKFIIMKAISILFVANSIYFFRTKKKKKTLKLRDHYFYDSFNFRVSKHYYKNLSFLFYQFSILKSVLDCHEKKLNLISMAYMEIGKIKQKKPEFKPKYLKIKLKILLDSRWV